LGGEPLAPRRLLSGYKVMKLGNILRVIGLGLAAALLTGCAEVAAVAPALSGGMPAAGSEVHSHTEIKLEDGNFITIRTNVVGSSKGFKLLGLITVVPATLDKAMNRMYASAEMQEGRPQTTANLVVEHSGIYVILFSIPSVTVRADVVEFLPSQNDNEEGGSRVLNVRRTRPPKMGPL
jgi:hypothetical protein